MSGLRGEDMNLKAAVVEQLEDDGHLKSFKMYAKPNGHITVAFADEFENARRGPFHFLDERDERKFEQGFGQCKTWKLPKSRFIKVNDEGVFKHSWSGIPTERYSLTYYALSLPEFAVPTKVEFKDPHSGRLYSNRITRDDQNNRIVLYLNCRSSRGIFDFTLHVTFRTDRNDFRNFTPSDEHNKQQDAEIPRYEDLLVPDEGRAVIQFFLQKFGAMQVPPDPSFSQIALVPQVQPKVITQLPDSREAKTEVPEKLLAKKADLSHYLDGAGLTEKQREVASLKWEYGFSVLRIAKRQRLHRSTVQERLARAQRKLRSTFGAAAPTLVADDE